MWLQKSLEMPVTGRRRRRRQLKQKATDQTELFPRLQSKARLLLSSGGGRGGEKGPFSTSTTTFLLQTPENRTTIHQGSHHLSAAEDALISRYVL